jgi:hypothetical protein|tara:strand:- start:762 stop:1583 length:822 start_codon:yes stop_codon:yes gene_type:complete
MSTRYSYRKNYSRGSYSGIEAAQRHIEEARAFSNEIGGTDEDIKQYFFALQGEKLESIFDEYGRLHGEKAENYARETLQKWSNGKTKMSGLVAKRLFNLLPPRMPIKKKYELANNVWKHFGPKSSHSYTVGPNSDVSAVASIIAEKLDEMVSKYNVPENVQNRFNWLAAGDVRLKEELLNHFRQLEKDLAVQKIKNELPVLQRQVREFGDITGRATSVIQVHKHEVYIWLDKRLDVDIVEGSPPPEGMLSGVFWWIIGGLLAMAFFAYSSKQY